MKPPKTAIFNPVIKHPNVNGNGTVCIDVIKNNWVCGNKLINII